MARVVQPDNYIQIDAMVIVENVVSCNMYTGKRCVKIAMHKNDYDELIRTGFFIRDGKAKDSANVLNTTTCYYPEL